MEKKYVLYDITNKQYFFGVNPQPVFSDDYYMEFDSNDDAEIRLDYEMREMPSYFTGRVFTVMPTLKLKSV